MSAIALPKQEEALLSWMQPPGNDGTSGITVENTPSKRKGTVLMGEAKKQKRESDTKQDKTRVHKRAFT